MNKAQLFLRISLALAYLSAVADRFGLWGPSGTSGVTWGNYQNFLGYTASLMAWLPEGLTHFLGHVATGLEVILAILMLTGIKVKESAYVSAALLMSFVFTMSTSYGVKSAMDYSVLTAAAASFALAEFARTTPSQQR
jgi:uncharacterized membrane protein YphA (DoxX/SURF4 family)